MIITRTPLRISFFGGGTDYPAWFEQHPAGVLAAAIDKYIYVSCRYLPPMFPHNVRVSYSRLEQVVGVEKVEHPAVRECLRFFGIEGDVEIHTDADLPARTGLGSSSTFTVGLLNALHAYQGTLALKEQLAREAIHVEQERIGEHVGCQDQFMAAYGGLNRIDFFPGQQFRVTPIPMSETRLDEFQDHWMLFFTGICRSASAVAGEQLASLPQLEKQLGALYALVDRGMEALSSGRFREFGELLHEGWMVKRTLSPRITNSVVDEAYEKARRCGAYGGKLLGAGGGGFLLVFCPPERQEAVLQALAPLVHVPAALDATGSQIIFYQPNHRVRDRKPAHAAAR
jgi:D-glycero-alpha-D-manno-heptose-7-phosphate kinase